MSLGLENLHNDKDTLVFHAGTGLLNGNIVTSGGRVCAAVGLGVSLSGARDSARKAIAAIRFDGMFYRKDIGNHVLKG